MNPMKRLISAIATPPSSSSSFSSSSSSSSSTTLLLSSTSYSNNLTTNFILYNITPKKNYFLESSKPVFVCLILCASCFLKTSKKEFLYGACFVRSKIPQHPTSYFSFHFLSLSHSLSPFAYYRSL